jgi:4-amino-4-deoxy-L-arabinose transferase-like glycosyltransferase
MRLWAGDWAAVWTGIVLALSYDFFRRTRAVSLDLWQLLFLLLAVWAVARGASAAGPAWWRRALWFAGAGLPLGLALVCKPFVALLSVPLAAVWLSWTRGWAAAAWLGVTLGVAVAVAAPWHLSMYALHGDAFLEQYVGRQVVARAAGELTASPLDAKPAWYYATHLASTHWPWLACVALALGQWWRAGRLSERGGAERWALVWTLGWLVALSAFADRRDRYAIPVMPSMAVFAGLWLAGLSAPAWVNWRTLGGAAAGLVLIAPFGMLIPVGGEDSEPGQWRELYEWIDARRISTGRPTELWQGGFSLDRGARIYLRCGRWPRTTRDELGRFVVDRNSGPPEGALLLYHRRDGLAPGPNENEAFRSGDLVVTRLGPGGWRPATVPDTGERDEPRSR